MTREREALGMIEGWLSEHPESFMTFSGGKDSTVLLHLLLRVHPQPRVAFFDTGLNFSQTTRFISFISKEWDVPITAIRTTPSPIEVLKEHGAYTLHPTSTVDFAKLVLDNYLQGAREHFSSRYSIYGVRASESRVRAALLGKTRGYTTQHKGKELIGASVAPLWNWQEGDVNSYILAHHLPLNPVYRRMRELGIPSKKRRTGLMLGSDLGLGGWAKAFAIDPVLGRYMESQFPLLRAYR